MKQCRWKKYLVIGRHSINNITFKNVYLIVYLLFLKYMHYLKLVEDADT